MINKKEGINEEIQSKRFLSVKMLSGEDLKLYLLFQFGSYNKASFVAGIDESRIHQIASGYDVPSSPDLIKKYAEAWKIDLVVLSALFERLRRVSS